MTHEEIQRIIEDAARRLFENQPNLSEFTSETRQTEWNLSHHFAWELRKAFPELDCDLDVTKPNYKSWRPDIVIHRRGTNEANLLVVELKRDGSAADLEADTEKIQYAWFRPPLSYRFGGVVNLRNDKSLDVRVLVNQQEQ